MDNFIECNNVEQANNVDLTKYVFLERLSVEMKKYCFKVRQRK